MILALGLFGLTLMVGGAYHAISGLIEPNGLVFEGVMAFGVGALINLLVFIIATLSNVISAFGEILDQQRKTYEKLIQTKPQQPSGGLQNFLGSILDKAKSEGEITITPINFDKDNPTDPLQNLMSTIENAMKKKGLRDMGIEELEKELQKAVKKDDFERAEEIKQEIQSRQNPDNQEDKAES